MLLALPIGILIGLSLGALGGGGSILTVPALVYLLGESAHSATTASLIIVGVTSIVGMAVHLRAGRVRVRSGIVFGILGAGGCLRRQPPVGQHRPQRLARGVLRAHGGRGGHDAVPPADQSRPGA